MLRFWVDPWNYQGESMDVKENVEFELLVFYL